MEQQNENTEGTKHVRYTVYMPEQIRNKFDSWAEREGFTTVTGRVNRTMAIKHLIEEKCND